MPAQEDGLAERSGKEMVKDGLPEITDIPAWLHVPTARPSEEGHRRPHVAMETLFF